MRVALVQLCSGDDLTQNREMLREMIARAAKNKPDLVLTPEVSNIIAQNRRSQRESLYPEGSDPTLLALRTQARQLKIWLLIGSLALKSPTSDPRFINRSFLINPNGDITAYYDKIHMFDAAINARETYNESAAFAPGNRAVIAETPFGTIGLTICYDLRFPHLYQSLARAGASIITIPAAFSITTGTAHWETLIRARAIETGAFILAPAQTGQHHDRRASHGHSLVVSPWGEILCDAGVETGISVVDLDLSSVDISRKRLPVLQHSRKFIGP